MIPNLVVDDLVHVFADGIVDTDALKLVLLGLVRVVNSVANSL